MHQTIPKLQLKMFMETIEGKHYEQEILKYDLDFESHSMISNH